MTTQKLVLKPSAFSVYKDQSRFRVLASGRRFGKTRLAASEMLKFATRKKGAIVWYLAPSYRMAARLMWGILKSIIPEQWIFKKNETNLTIILINGSIISLCGGENYDSLRGSGIDFIVLDEFAFMRPAVWSEVIRPALSDKQGHALFISSPDGLNHFYDFYQRDAKMPGQGWKSWQFTTLDGGWVPPEEVEAARRELDSRTFDQEYMGEFKSFSGRVAYEFGRANYEHELWHNPNKELIVGLDFNSAPGIAAIMQDQVMPGQFEIVKVGNETIKSQVIGTGAIGEVWIPQHSNTLLVCQKLYADWKGHKGPITFYGDPAGGQKKSSGVQGTDWELVQNFFRQTEWRDRITYDIPRAHPSVRSRINAMNARIKSIDGVIRFMVDAAAAPHIIDDFERLTVLEGSNGEIDKNADKKIGHLFDACSYTIERRHPIFDGHAATVIDL